MCVSEFCVQGGKLNWCKFLMDKLFQACSEAQEKGRYFTFGYLLISFTMYKWQPPQGRQLIPSPDDICIAMQHEP